MFRSWSITAFIVLLTIFWSVTFAPIATFLNNDTIREFLPALSEILDAHPLARSLVTTQLPTLTATLLTVAVPYLYDCKSFVTPTLRRHRTHISHRACKLPRHDFSRRC